MMINCSMKNGKLAFFQLTFLMIGLSLFVDAFNGFFLSGLGIDPKLSAAYKLLLLILVLYQIGTHSTKTLAWILIFFLVMLIGPIITFISTTDIAGFIDDLTSGLKLYTAIIIFVYIAHLCEKWPCLVQKYGKWCLQFAFSVLLINIILGVMGFGFSSYDWGGSDPDASNQIGIKGFFYAGNELSGIFIVLFGAALHLLWQKHKVLYFLFTPVALAVSILIATKAAMLSCILLVFAIPLFNERNRLLNLTWLKVKMILPVVIAIVILGIILVPIFESTGLWGRFMWFYQKKGFIGIILSGRDEFIFTALEAFMHHASLSDILFGFSKTGLGQITKNAMEIDPIDMYFWHGISGMILFMAYVGVFFRVAYLAAVKRDSQWGPCVLIVNIALFSVSLIAGHIITSGMLAPLLGLINGMAYADLVLKPNDTNKNHLLEMNRSV